MFFLVSPMSLVHFGVLHIMLVYKSNSNSTAKLDVVQVCFHAQHTMNKCCFVSVWNNIKATFIHCVLCMKKCCFVSVWNNIIISVCYFFSNLVKAQKIANGVFGLQRDKEKNEKYNFVSCLSPT